MKIACLRAHDALSHIMCLDLLLELLFNRHYLGVEGKKVAVKHIEWQDSNGAPPFRNLISTMNKKNLEVVTMEMFIGLALNLLVFIACVSVWWECLCHVPP